jgi:hypothetical protein
MKNQLGDSNHVNRGVIKHILLILSQFSRIHAWMADNPGRLGCDAKMVNCQGLKSSNERFAADPRGSKDPTIEITAVWMACPVLNGPLLQFASRNTCIALIPGSLVSENAADHLFASLEIP